MSSTEAFSGKNHPLNANLRIRVWWDQFLTILYIEFGKTLISKRTFVCYVLAFLPVLLLGVATFESDVQGDPLFGSIEIAREIFGQIFMTFILGGVVFFGCAVIFTTLFRGEILDRSIHYYVLTPLRREILVIAKYMAGLLSAMIIFGFSAIACFLFLYLPFGVDLLIADISNGLVLSQIGRYLGIIFLASMGYGSVFMLTGLLFNNPLIPIVLVAGWETIHFILPPALKMFSIIFYLKGLLPITLDEGFLAIIVAPPPVWISILGMFGLCLVTILISAYLFSRIEVEYTDD